MVHLKVLLDNAESVKNKRAQNGLKEGHSNAILSKKLVTILTDLELEVNLLDFEKIILI